MKTIVTIDFDIIMWKNLPLYNHLVGDKIDTSVLERITPLLFYVDADLILYNKLTEYIIFLLKKINKENIVFIDSHEKVLDYITEPVDVINIDHHHDLGYNEMQRENKKYACANWCYWGLKDNKIKNLFWIHNNTSDPFEPIKEKFNITEMEDMHNIDLQKIIIPEKLILCSSFEWIPDQFKPLFELWKKIVYNYNV